MNKAKPEKNVQTLEKSKIEEKYVNNNERESKKIEPN
jgi:hypothetical protein